MLAHKLDTYKEKYSNVVLERTDDGVLLVRLHTRGGELLWDFVAHEECTALFEDVGRDAENKVIILTGTDGAFCREHAPPSGEMTLEFWQGAHYDAKRLIMGHLDIEQPMIAAINGPATVHSEMALLCDIVLAAPDAVFADQHFSNGLVPGDGAQVLWPLLLGPSRGRHFLLTGQEIDAEEALRVGVVGEVTPKRDLLHRAYEVAEMILTRPRLTVRWTRTVMVQQLRRLYLDNLGYGLQTEGLGTLDHWPPATPTSPPRDVSPGGK
jgi:enoyl-CoA hydratase/carnithine racemase